jgi:hypothetical protein
MLQAQRYRKYCVRGFRLQLNANAPDVGQKVKILLPQPIFYAALRLLHCSSALESSRLTYSDGGSLK